MGGIETAPGRDSGGWGLTHPGKSSRLPQSLKQGPAPLALPHIRQLGAEEKMDRDNVSSLSGTPISLNLCHRPQSSPQPLWSNLPLHRNWSTFLSAGSLGHSIACDKGQILQHPHLNHASAPPHMLLVPEPRAVSLLPAITQPVPAAWNVRSLSVP